MNKNKKHILLLMLAFNNLVFADSIPVDPDDSDKCKQPLVAAGEEYSEYCDCVNSVPNWKFLHGFIVISDMEVVNSSEIDYFTDKSDYKRCTATSDGEFDARYSKHVKEGAEWEIGSSAGVTADVNFLWLIEAELEVTISGTYGENSASEVRIQVGHKVAAGDCRHAFAWGGANFKINGAAKIPATIHCLWKSRKCGSCPNGLIVSTEDDDRVDIRFHNKDDEGNTHSIDRKFEETDTQADCRSYDGVNCDCDTTSPGGEEPEAPEWFRNGSW